MWSSKLCQRYVSKYGKNVLIGWYKMPKSFQIHLSRTNEEKIYHPVVFMNLSSCLLLTWSNLSFEIWQVKSKKDNAPMYFYDEKKIQVRPKNPRKVSIWEKCSYEYWVSMWREFLMVEAIFTLGNLDSKLLTGQNLN